MTDWFDWGFALLLGATAVAVWVLQQQRHDACQGRLAAEQQKRAEKQRLESQLQLTRQERQAALVQMEKEIEEAGRLQRAEETRQRCAAAAAAALQLEAACRATQDRLQRQRAAWVRERRLQHEAWEAERHRREEEQRRDEQRLREEREQSEKRAAAQDLARRAEALERRRQWLHQQERALMLRRAADQARLEARLRQAERAQKLEQEMQRALLQSRQDEVERQQREALRQAGLARQEREKLRKQAEADERAREADKRARAESALRSRAEQQRRAALEQARVKERERAWRQRLHQDLPEPRPCQDPAARDMAAFCQQRSPPQPATLPRTDKLSNLVRFTEPNLPLIAVFPGHGPYHTHASCSLLRTEPTCPQVVHPIQQREQYALLRSRLSQCAHCSWASGWGTGF